MKFPLIHANPPLEDFEIGNYGLVVLERWWKKIDFFQIMNITCKWEIFVFKKRGGGWD